MGEIVKKPWFAKGLRFQCTGCGKCCSGPDGYVFLTETDLKQLAAHLQLAPKAFAKSYCRLVDEKYALLDRPGTVDCIFLKEKRCSVYEVRPIQCRTFPWWSHNLAKKRDWKETAASCEGVDHPDAPLIPLSQIEAERATYLDSMLEQNFSLD